MSTDHTFPACETTPALTLTPAQPPELASEPLREPPSLFAHTNLANRAARMEQIRDIVADKCGVTVAEIQSHARHAAIAWIRMVCAYLCRECTGATWAEIARFMDRDHASIMHAHRRVRECLELYPRSREEIQVLLAAIQE